jgi:predicted Zn-ribbon and HTH transcriptional regulator
MRDLTGAPIPPERTETDRQRLLRELDRGESFTVPDLSKLAGISQSQVTTLLDAMLSSGAVKLEVLPPYCMSCEFRFEGRSRSSRPSRCPQCRSGRIARAQFQLR